MPEKYMTPTAVIPIILRSINGTLGILLHKRQNTGYGDGLWDCAASGHVEAAESPKSALVREAMEEIGIAVQEEDIQFATMMYHFESGRSTYVNVYFVVECFIGEPRIMEPDKSSELAWFSLDALPPTLLPDRVRAIENYRAGIAYDEIGTVRYAR